ncbi:uncharacterized protein CTRU02_206971 [Colletotrichum truncatum]|uniref:Uncharacterized protein n=1 Tax=Colletotrichum truncatum TaxID=5467 RepID=A0ACC3YZ47_COLTU
MRENRDQQQNLNRPSPVGIASPPQVASRSERRIGQRARFTSSWSPQFLLFGNDEAHKQAEEIKSLRSYNSELLQQLEQQCTSLRQCDDMLEENGKHIRELEQQLKGSERTYRDDIKKHGERINELQDTVSALKEQIFELQTAKAIADDIKISDNAILEIWKRMAYNIRSTAITHLTHCPSKEELKGSYQDRPSAVSQMASTDYDCLQDENMRHLVVENYIWRFVNSHIFGGGQLQELSGAWGGGAGVRLYSLSKCLIFQITCQNAAEFFSWRSQAAIMIDELVGFRNQILQQLAMTGHITFSSLLPPGKRHDKSARNALGREFLSICKDAVELQSIFMKSKAYFFVHWENATKSGMEKVVYRPDDMEAEDWGKTLGDKSVVKINISPGLLKCGTANGVDYDRRIWLVKPRVFCD